MFFYLVFCCLFKHTPTTQTPNNQPLCYFVVTHCFSIFVDYILFSLFFDAITTRAHWYFYSAYFPIVAAQSAYRHHSIRSSTACSYGAFLVTCTHFCLALSRLVCAILYCINYCSFTEYYSQFRYHTLVKSAYFVRCKNRRERNCIDN